MIEMKGKDNREEEKGQQRVSHNDREERKL